MIKKYDVSVVIPTYNNIDFIKETLDSVNISKKNYNIEILVGIDGCEKTFNFVKHNFFDENIKFYIFNTNGGPYTIKNTLAKSSKSDKIIFFDSDDIMGADLISKVIRSLDLFKICKFRYINFTGDFSGKLKNKSHFAEGVFGIQKDLFLSMNGFEPWVCAADSDFWGRIYKSKVKTHFMSDVLMYRRSHNQQLTKKKETGMRSALRSHYWRLSKSKRGDGNPTYISVRDFFEVDSLNSEQLRLEQNEFFKTKEELGKNIEVLLNKSSLFVPNESYKKHPPVELNYDPINKLMSKKKNITEKITLDKTEENKPNDRQNLFDKKRKK